MQNNETTPHFDEATEGQKVVRYDGEYSMSLWLTPQTAASAQDSKERTGRYSYLPIDQLRELNSEVRERISTEYSQIKTLESEEGKKLGIRVVNAEAAEGTIGVMSAWSTDAEWENIRGQIEALALRHPGAKIVFIETPGMGFSDGLDEKKKARMSKSGSYLPMAEQISECLELSDFSFDVLVGTSEGARAVIALSALLKSKKPDKPITVVGIDSPGTDDRSLVSFGYGFAVKEGGMQKKVKTNSPDEPMVEAHTKKDTPLGNKGLKKFVDRQYLPRVNTMRKAGLEADVAAACSLGVDIYDFRSENSAIADAKKAEKIAKNTPGYTTITNPKAPHAIIETNPFALSQLVDQALSLENAKKGLFEDPSAAIAKQQVDEDLLL